MPGERSLSPIPPVDPRFSSWRLTYQAVLSETDHQALFTRVEAAEAAILTRREIWSETRSITPNGRLWKRHWPI